MLPRCVRIAVLTLLGLVLGGCTAIAITGAVVGTGVAVASTAVSAGVAVGKGAVYVATAPFGSDEDDSGKKDSNKDSNKRDSNNK